MVGGLVFCRTSLSLSVSGVGTQQAEPGMRRYVPSLFQERPWCFSSVLTAGDSAMWLAQILVGDGEVRDSSAQETGTGRESSRRTETITYGPK